MGSQGGPLSLKCLPAPALTKPQFSEPQRMVASSWFGLASFDGSGVWTTLRVKTVDFSLIVCVSAQDSSQGKIGFVLWEFDISPWVFWGADAKSKSLPQPGVCMNPDNLVVLRPVGLCGVPLSSHCHGFYFCILKVPSHLPKATPALFLERPCCSLHSLRDGGLTFG